MSLDFANNLTRDDLNVYFHEIISPIFSEKYDNVGLLFGDGLNHRIALRKREDSEMEPKEIREIEDTFIESYGFYAPFCLLNISYSDKYIFLNIEHYIINPISLLPEDLQEPSEHIQTIFDDLINVWGVKIRYRASCNDYVFIYKDRFVTLTHQDKSEEIEMDLVRRYLKLSI